MKLALPSPSRSRKPILGERCHPLVRRGGAELDAALLRLHAAQEMAEFWEGARAVLHLALPLHFVCMCLRPFALMPSTVFRERAPFASEAEFQLFQELNPLQTHLATHAGLPTMRMSDVVSDNELLETEFYRRFMEPHDDRYYAALNFWHGGLFQGLIGLHRSSGEHDFTDTDIAFLGQLHPHFETVLQRILSLHRERAVRLSLEKLLVNLPIATVLLDWELRVACRNRSAVELCARWNLGSERASQEKCNDQFQLPPEVLAYCEQFKRNWNPCLHRTCPLTSSSGVYFSHPVEVGLRVSINLLTLDAAPLSMPIFLVRLEHHETSPTGGGTERRAEERLGPLSRLTHREREVALLVSRGLSNDEVAQKLRKSVLTVKKQLRSIYEKLDVANRGRLTALIH